MDKVNAIGFPGGSRSRVNRSGERARNGAASPEDDRIIDEWRAAHRAVLNTFQESLRRRTRDKNVIVAQRHKRKSTILGKLLRYPKMQLSRMDDVAGCRLIFPSIKDLYDFRYQFHSARFQHQRRNGVDKYDYIKKPKSTGYRGVHDVYSYDVNSDAGRPLKGLSVEIQYRTLVQHAWATAVEVIGFITESQPKFQKGDSRYELAMALSSEILARNSEHNVGPFPAKSDNDLVVEFERLDREIGLMKLLKGLKVAGPEVAVTTKRNTILVYSPDGTLSTLSFRDARTALFVLFDMEKSNPGADIVLVKADKSEDVRLAFKNYFSDAGDFIEQIEKGCKALSGNRAG